MGRLSREEDQKIRSTRLVLTYLEQATHGIFNARSSCMLAAAHPTVKGAIDPEAAALRDQAAALLLQAQEKLQAAAEAQQLLLNHAIGRSEL